LSIYDINVSTELPVGSARPSQQEKDLYALKSLNRLAWEKNQGKNVAVGGLDGVVSVFEVGSDLGGQEGRGDAWVGLRKWAGRLEAARGREN
jgi:dynein intermediate chain